MSHPHPHPKPLAPSASITLEPLFLDRSSSGEALAQTVETGRVLFIARREGKVCGMQLVSIQPERSALVFLPELHEATSADAESVADLLMNACLHHAQQQDALFCQTILPQTLATTVEFERHSRLLDRHGFQKITTAQILERTLLPNDLVKLLQCETAHVAERSAIGTMAREEPFVNGVLIAERSATWQGEAVLSADGSKWLKYDATTNHERFVATVAATYEESPDCPEIHAFRSAAQAVQGYLTVGSSPGSAWRLLCQSDGSPVGIWLAAIQPEQTWELLYLGVPPNSRTQGIGKRLLENVVTTAHEAGANRIIVAVDERNLAALHLYQAHQFQLIDQQQVWIRPTFTETAIES